MDDAIVMGLIFGGVAGLIVGAAPMVYGMTRQRPALAFGGFAACAVSGAVLGLLLAVPVAGVFCYLISKSAAPTLGSPQHANLDARIAELARLHDEGHLSDEEYARAKAKLIGA
ncbi:SHOCT domain-containing protein [Deinococcus soli (ex Cha et al. 2016)]|uniref:Cytochrome b561 n=2 Tax=Deinococcus soli (ex Cha et al. 2016) TaxID=1309411 RepID=A0AAE3XEB7_9DEIO|nr:SHOCT domain-containing protein [Deinococcus soli (ex Cha et al. 2016)]MDR6218927.1 cytochrome b561 [Deinococcus soli (ex Cha et al. 2016)]MDR6328724.1 cytochrome b561 [Deinococcus soli (ex Cha et al. 2016)]MDR6751789.1 cytochrome b561 [Deinococcus soli (ex Cha et al. 2016)]